MNDNKQATEAKIETIATQQENVVTPTQTTEVDFEAALKEKDAALAQIAKEKENYRKAYLKAGGKPEAIQSDTDEPEDLDTRIARTVKEQLLATREAQLQVEKDQTISALLKRNKEVETALKNRSDITSVSGNGSNQEKPEGKKDNYFSNEQIASMKAKGYSDVKIEALKKTMQNPSGQTNITN